MISPTDMAHLAAHVAIEMWEVGLPSWAGNKDAHQGPPYSAKNCHWLKDKREWDEMRVFGCDFVLDSWLWLWLGFEDRKISAEF